jgi:hypothetical protein
MAQTVDRTPADASAETVMIPTWTRQPRFRLAVTEAMVVVGGHRGDMNSVTSEANVERGIGQRTQHRRAGRQGSMDRGRAGTAP